MSTVHRDAAWSSLRVRLRLRLGFAVAAVAAVLPPLRASGLAVGCVVGLVATAIWCLGFACPGCGRPFFRKGGWQHGLARRCVHCGLPRYQAPAVDAAMGTRGRP
jgi:hypothetical protein